MRSSATASGRASNAALSQPEMIWPETAHPAFHKSAHMFGLKVIVAPTDPVTTQVDVDFVRDAITPNTAMIVCVRGQLSVRHDRPDRGAVGRGAREGHRACTSTAASAAGSCRGARNSATRISRCSISAIPGVTSISADTHKYGYGLKGTSVLAWRDKSYRQHQYYMLTDWKGGAYASPGLAGSRSGGLIAATWASMMRLGRQGYLERAQRRSSTPRSPCSAPSPATPS